MFLSTTENIVLLMREILSLLETTKISLILLAGGFSEWRFVHDAARDVFPLRRVIVPEDSVLGVLKGALLYGHHSDYIQKRVMRFTYGVKTICSMTDGSMIEPAWSKLTEKIKWTTYSSSL